MSSLKELEKLGGFVPDKPVEKQIKFTLDGETEIDATIHIKRLNIDEYETLFLSGKDEKSKTARIISLGVMLGEGGKEKISLEKAVTLHPALASAMVSAFHEVNIPKKASHPKSDSSAT
jgi:hypothetical protein